MSERPDLPYEFRGQALSLGQLRLLLADACGMAGEPAATFTEGAVFLRGERQTIMFSLTRRADGVAVVDPDWCAD